jgi:hypothetical protein
VCRRSRSAATRGAPARRSVEGWGRVPSSGRQCGPATAYAAAFAPWCAVLKRSGIAVPPCRYRTVPPGPPSRAEVPWILGSAGRGHLRLAMCCRSASRGGLRVSGPRTGSAPYAGIHASTSLPIRSPAPWSCPAKARRSGSRASGSGRRRSAAWSCSSGGCWIGGAGTWSIRQAEPGIGTDGRSASGRTIRCPPPPAPSDRHTRVRPGRGRR